MIRARRVRSVATIALAGWLCVAASACSSDGTTSATTDVTVEATPTTPVKTPTTTTTTDAPETTTVRTTQKPAQSTTTTVEGVEPTMPLTGLPILDILAAGRPALVVKVDNHPDARPQSGINTADIVYEENVEKLTRFALVFQSNGADPVGPIRSGRTQDIDLLGSLNRPLYAWSGGNGRVTSAILASDLREISPRSNGPFFRSSDRKSPHNLYSNVSALYALSPLDASAPPPQFEYRAEGDDPAGVEVTGVKLAMDNVDVAWEWNAAEQKFLRFQDGSVHKDTVGDAQVSTENVVVLFVAYKPSPADARSPEAQTVGFGEAWVYTGETVVKGAWIREQRTDPFTLKDVAGEPILLTPGRTFVELARVGKVVTVNDGDELEDVPFP